MNGSNPTTSCWQKKHKQQGFFFINNLILLLMYIGYIVSNLVYTVNQVISPIIIVFDVFLLGVSLPLRLVIQTLHYFNISYSSKLLLEFLIISYQFIGVAAIFGIIFGLFDLVVFMFVQWIFNWKITKFDIGGITDWISFFWVLVFGKNDKEKGSNDTDTVIMKKLDKDDKILAINVNSEILNLNKEEIKNMLVNSRIQERLKQNNNISRDNNKETIAGKGKVGYKAKEQKEMEDTIQNIENKNDDIKASSSSLFSQKNSGLVNGKISNKILSIETDTESESETIDGTLFSKTTITSAATRTTTPELSHSDPSLVEKTNQFDE